LELFTELGAELFLESLSNPGLPENVQGLYFGGGFGSFAQDLAENRLAEAVQRALGGHADLCGVG